MTTRPEPWRHQIEALEFAQDKVGVMLAMEMGTGKDLRDDTPIPTPGGWVDIGKIQLGQRVLDEHGRACTVTGLFPQGDREVFSVDFDDGAGLVAGAGHLWTTLRERDRPGPGVPWDWAKGAGVLTTAEMERSLPEGHRIPTASGESARRVTAVTPAGTAPTTCIAVDSPSSLFLAGPQMVPTHNTRVAIDLIAARGHRRILALCPLSIVDHVWPQQVATHQESPIIVVPLGSKLNGVKARGKAVEKAMRRVRDHTTVMVVINYESAWRSPLKEWIEAQRWDLMILDECHPAGTPIATPDGPREIQELGEGDAVWGVDHHSGRIVRTTVAHTFRRENQEELVRVGETLMTPEHPVWTRKGYTPAGEVGTENHVCRLAEEGDPDAHPDLRMAPVRALGVQKDTDVLRETALWKSVDPPPGP